MSISGFEYLPPVPRKVRGGSRTNLLLPGIPAEHGHRSDPVITEFEGISHRTQPCRIRNVTGLNRCPLRCFHSGQAGGLPYRAAGRLASLSNALAEQPSPDQAANLVEIIFTICLLYTSDAADE